MKHSRLHIFTIVYFVTLLPLVIAGQDFILETNANTITIIGYTGAGGDVIITDTINDMPVTGIRGWAFGGTAITRLFIPHSVTNIGLGIAASCEDLLEICVDPENPFYSSIDGILFDKDQTMIIQFPGGKSGSDMLPNTLRRIANSAFWGSTKLIRFDIPDGVTSIEDYAFEWCTNLKHITIPSSVTNIGVSAFELCVALTNVVFRDCSASIGPWAFSMCEALRHVIIPGSIQSIGNWAFMWCTNITNVTLMEGVRQLESYAFDHCSALTNFVIPASVTNIQSRVWNYCVKLRSFSVDEQNEFYKSVDGVLFNKTGSVLLQWPRAKGRDYIIPESVVTIGDWAFHLSAIRSITIPSNVRNIGGAAFAESSLERVEVLPGTVTVGDSAFEGCESLQYVSLPNTVSSIGDRAFSECRKLYGIKIPESVTNIGRAAFERCERLDVVWIPLGVREISEGTFRGCSRLTSVKLPGSVVSIGSRAFAYCNSLTALSLPESIVNIDEWAFYSCVRLTNVFLPRNVTNVGATAFGGCRALSEINVDPENIAYTSVDGVLFDKEMKKLVQCPGGKTGNYSVPMSVLRVVQGAFDGCENLVSVIMPAGIEILDDYTFYGCSVLRSVYFRGDAPLMGTKVFYLSGVSNVFYLPGARGWENECGGRPTALWLPRLEFKASDVGGGPIRFGMVITWAAGQTVVVEACSELNIDVWVPLRTNNLASDSVVFEDYEWTNSMSRFYRVRSP